MRITGGTYKGFQLESPKNGDIRPTSDKVRQAIFNMLKHGSWRQEIGFSLEGAHVLDVFCGTGSLGLEALSHGAATCSFVDLNPQLARKNAAHLNVPNARFIKSPIEKWRSPADTAQPYDLVFMDPPYNQDLVKPAITQLLSLNCISPQALFVIEEAKAKLGTLGLPAQFHILNEKKYSDTGITIAYYKGI